LHMGHWSVGKGMSGMAVKKSEGKCRF